MRARGRLRRRPPRRGRGVPRLRRGLGRPHASRPRPRVDRLRHARARDPPGPAGPRGGRGRADGAVRRTRDEKITQCCDMRRRADLPFVCPGDVPPRVDQPRGFPAAARWQLQSARPPLPDIFGCEDEPANGLDPAGIVEIRELLLELTRQQGVTVFMSSHILAEVSRLAGRIGIIHQGRLLQELNTDELERNRSKRLLLRSRDVEAACRVLTAAGQPAKILQNGSIELRNAKSVDHPDEINAILVKAGASPTQLMVEEEELEQYFLRLVGTNGGPQNG